MKRKNIYLLSILLLVSFSIFWGCSHQIEIYSKNETVEFKLPEYPQSTHPTLLHWEVSIINKDGKSIQKVDANKKSFEICLLKNQPTAIICQPITKLNTLLDEKVAFFHPAGCVYPAEMNITWHGGFVANIFESLVQGNNYNFDPFEERFISLFNWKKFTNNIYLKYQKALLTNEYFNPWCIDKEKILLAINSNQFNTYSIKERKYETKEFYIEPINEINSTLKLYSRFILHPEITCSVKENKIFCTIPYTKSTTPYIVNPENIFLFDNQLIKILSNKNGQVILAITGFEQ